MTNILKSTALAVGLLVSSTVASLALTPVGEAFTPEGAPKSAPFWQNFIGEKGDVHWTYANNFRRDAGLVEKFQTTDVMGTIYSRPENEGKFGLDEKGYPTFKVGETYLLPVVRAIGVSVAQATDAAVPVTQADFDALAKRQAVDFKTLSEEVAAGFAAIGAATSGFAHKLDEQSAKVADQGASIDMLADWAESNAALGERNGVAIAETNRRVTETQGDLAQFRANSKAAEAALREDIAATNSRVTEGFAQVSSDVADQNNRLDGFEAELAKPLGYSLVQTVLGQTAADWYQVHPIWGGIMMVATIVFGLWLIMLVTAWLMARPAVKKASTALEQSTAALAEVAVVKAAQLDHGQHVADHAQCLSALEEVQADMAATVATMSDINIADFDWHPNNASQEELAGLTGGEAGAKAWRLTHRATGAQYLVRFGRDENTPNGQVQSDLIRNIKMGLLADPMRCTERNLKLKIVEAIKAGRLQPTTTMVLAVA